MIPTELIQKAELIRKTFSEIPELLSNSKVFNNIINQSDPNDDSSLRDLKRSYDQLGKSMNHDRVKEPFRSDFTCAFVGASSSGKTSILAEIFPELAKRKWLVVDQNDTTAQALVIRYTKEEQVASSVSVKSWNYDQIKRLVETSKNLDDIYTSYYPQEELISIDGSDFLKNTRTVFRFPKKIDLTPFRSSYSLSQEELSNEQFIEDLTIKCDVKTNRLNTSAIITENGKGYNALQLRTVIEEVTLYDSFSQLIDWSSDEVRSLTFIDTPGLKTEGSLNDEILAPVLKNKSQRIIIELLKKDELDIIVNLCLVAIENPFSDLWTAVKEEISDDEADFLGERLILAINGVNKLVEGAFSYRDLWDKDDRVDPYKAAIQNYFISKLTSGSHPITPKRICLLDSVRWTPGDYGNFYRTHRPKFDASAIESGKGYSTLKELGMIETFKENIDALCDPEDRGQGYLVRQILELIKENGPLLFLRKNLQRTDLVESVRDFRKKLSDFFNEDGSLNLIARQEMIKRCLFFLDKNDPFAIDVFASQELDHLIDDAVNRSAESSTKEDWVKESFKKSCSHLLMVILRKTSHRISDSDRSQFKEYLNAQVNNWFRIWGYKTCNIEPPGPQNRHADIIVSHCIRTHVREIIHQMIRDEKLDSSNFDQTPEDQEAIKNVFLSLNYIIKTFESLLKTASRSRVS